MRRVLWPALVRGLGYLQRIEGILVLWIGHGLDLYLITDARDDRWAREEESLPDETKQQIPRQALA